MAALPGQLPAYDALTSQHLVEVNRILPKLHASSMPKSPWRKYVPFEAWTDELGFAAYRAVMRQGIAPQDAAWQLNAPSTPASTPGAGDQFDNAQAPTYLIPNGSDKYLITPETAQFSSPEYDLEDLRASVVAMEQLVWTTSHFREGVYEAMDVKLRYQHFLATNNFWAITNDPSNCIVKFAKDHTTSLATLGGLTTNPTGALTMPVLGVVYNKLMASPCGDNQFGVTDDGDPVFLAITDPSVKETLISGLDKQTANINFAWMGAQGESLESQAPQKAVTYKGWYITPDQNMPRASYAGGVLTLIPKWSYTAGSGNGTIAVPNPAWETATIGFTVVIVPGAYNALVKQPTNYGDLFKAQTYTGEMMVLNIQDRLHNIKGNKAFLFSTASLAPGPILPDTMYWLTHRIVTTVGSY